MLFSESVTSKQRFMHSRRTREKGTVILICPRCHSNLEWSDTSINSSSSTKFTLVFRTPQHFISSCRISQSYFQSRSCHYGVSVRQLVVIMTIYSSGSEELNFLSSQRGTCWSHSVLSYLFLCDVGFVHLSRFSLSSYFDLLQVCPSVPLSIICFFPFRLFWVIVAELLNILLHTQKRKCLRSAPEFPSGITKLPPHPGEAAHSYLLYFEFTPLVH